LKNASAIKLAVIAQLVTIVVDLHIKIKEQRKAERRELIGINKLSIATGINKNSRASEDIPEANTSAIRHSRV